MSDRVLVVADAAGHILERLSRAWIEHGTSSREHTLVCADTRHAYALRKQGTSAGLIFWVDNLNFVRFPRAARVPQCVMEHHINDGELQSHLAALSAADAVATSSVRWQKHLAEIANIDATLIPYVIDTELFVPRDRAATRRALGIPDQAYVIGFSAKARADAFGRKGVDLFVEVVRTAATRWSDVAVLLIGSGWELLARTIEESGARVFLQEPARSEDTAMFYPAMDVFLCTSKEEGGPCTILEAMSCEVPVITTDVGHVPEVVSDEENGFIVRERDPGAFLVRIEALRDDAGKAARIAREGRTFVRVHRDERLVGPSIAFDAMYGAAERRFRERGEYELAARIPSILHLGARYAVGRLRRWIS